MNFSKNVKVYMNIWAHQYSQISICSWCSHTKEHGLGLRTPKRRGGLLSPSERLAASAAATPLATTPRAYILFGANTQNMLFGVTTLNWCSCLHLSLSPNKNIFIIHKYKNTKFTKLQTLQTIQQLQNMNYVTYTYYKI